MKTLKEELVQPTFWQRIKAQHKILVFTFVMSGIFTAAAFILLYFDSETTAASVNLALFIIIILSAITNVTTMFFYVSMNGNVSIIANHIIRAEEEATRHQRFQDNFEFTDLEEEMDDGQAEDQAGIVAQLDALEAQTGKENPDSEDGSGLSPAALAQESQAKMRNRTPKVVAQETTKNIVAQTVRALGQLDQFKDRIALGSENTIVVSESPIPQKSADTPNAGVLIGDTQELPHIPRAADNENVVNMSASDPRVLGADTQEINTGEINAALSDEALNAADDLQTEPQIPSVQEQAAELGVDEKYLGFVLRMNGCRDYHQLNKTIQTGLTNLGNRTRRAAAG